MFSLDSECPLTDLTPIRSVTESDLTKLPEHLKPVWEASSGSLTEEQKHAFLGLLFKHQNAYAKSKFDLCCTSIVTHKIDAQCQIYWLYQSLNLAIEDRVMFMADDEVFHHLFSAQSLNVLC